MDEYDWNCLHATEYNLNVTSLPDCCKEYLTVTKCKTSPLLRIKYWTVWCMDHLSASSYTRVTNCQTWSDFLWLKLVDIFDEVLFLWTFAKIFKYGNIQKTNLTPYKELNLLIYWMPSYVKEVIHIEKWSRYFLATMYKKNQLKQKTNEHNKLKKCLKVHKSVW